MKSFRNFIKNVVIEDNNSNKKLLENIADAIENYIKYVNKNGYGYDLTNENFKFSELYNFYTGDMPFNYFKEYYENNISLIYKELAKRDIYVWKHIKSNLETFLYSGSDKEDFIYYLLMGDIVSIKDLSSKDIDNLIHDFDISGHEYDYDDLMMNADSQDEVAKYIVSHKLDKGAFAIKRLN